MFPENQHGDFMHKIGIMEGQIKALQELTHSMQLEKTRDSTAIFSRLNAIQSSVTTVATDMAVLKGVRQNYQAWMMLWMPVGTAFMVWGMDHIFK